MFIKQCFDFSHQLINQTTPNVLVDDSIVDYDAAKISKMCQSAKYFYHYLIIPPHHQAVIVGYTK